ncbi:MAG: RNA polymerase sigma factor SigJ [Desertimonas sp.]
MSVDIFDSHRHRLVGIAYGMLGSVDEAEDVVQDAWFRWSSADRSGILDPVAYLSTIVTRLSIDRLRSAQVRREQYVGPWLPEPLVRDPADPADLFADAERISMALLVVMERLDPVQRAIMLLRDVFDYDYSEIAEIVGRSKANCRQIAKRARDRVGDPDLTPRGASPDDQRVAELILQALREGDHETLREHLAADVVMWSDGGGKRRAAMQPVYGLERVLTFLRAVSGDGRERGGTADAVLANCQPAIRAEFEGVVEAVMTLTVRDGLVSSIHVQRNPDKLLRARS